MIKEQIYFIHLISDVWLMLYLYPFITYFRKLYYNLGVSCLIRKTKINSNCLKLILMMIILLYQRIVKMKIQSIKSSWSCSNRPSKSFIKHMIKTLYTWSLHWFSSLASLLIWIMGRYLLVQKRLRWRWKQTIWDMAH